MKFLALLLAAFSAFFCTVLAANGTTSSPPKMPDLSKLSPCALQCVIKSITNQKCNGPLDTKCICTEGFTNDATNCLFTCDEKDILPALNLERELCPDLGLPDLNPISDCARSQVYKTLQNVHCAGPLDKNCICGIPFALNVATSLLLRCGITAVPGALGLEIGICKGNGGLAKCTATGIWRLLQPQCLLNPHARSMRADAAVAIAARRLGLDA